MLGIKSLIAFSTKPMRKSFFKWAGILMLGIFLLFVCGIYVIHKANEFNDNQAILVEVSDMGIATLDDHRQKFSASLAGVRWTTNPTFLVEAHKLIEEAQRNYVAFSVLKDGTVKIWYATESEPANLNEKLDVLSAKAAALESKRQP